MDNKDFAQALKGMMDAWDKIENEVLRRYPRESTTWQYEMTVRLFEKLAGLDKNKREG